jgi:hypothetical protein
MSKKDPTKAEKLLDAHVTFMVDNLTGEGLGVLLKSEIDLALKNAAKITLNEAVTRDMIKATAKTYAVDLELGGAMPELIGDIARNIYAHEIQDKARVKDLLSDHQFNEVLNKVLEMKEARKQLVHEVISNPLYSALASDILYQGIKGYLTQNVMNKNIPGMSSMMKLGKSMMSLASPGLDKSIEEGLKKYIHKNIKSTLAESEHFLLETLDDDKLRDMVQDVWHDVKKQPVGTFRNFVKSEDVEEFFVVGYELWRELRKTEYYSAVINSGIDSFFDKYGDTSLTDLLGEVGLSADQLLAEAMRFAPHVLKVLKKKKILEPLVRRNLERFYQTDEVTAILAE